VIGVSTFSAAPKAWPCLVFNRENWKMRGGE